jgi:ribosome maturation factor RimP
MEGGPNRPPFCVLDNDSTDPSDSIAQHSSLEARIHAEIELSLTHMGYEIVRVSVLGRDRPTVQVMADRADGSMIAIEDCEKINDVVSATLDVADLIKTAWTLEVSSAGIDRPLTRVKDWNRFAGHQARAEVNMPVDGRKRFTGVVLGADETVARMRLDDGTEVALPLSDMRRAKLVLTDALIAATAQQKPANKTN